MGEGTLVNINDKVYQQDVQLRERHNTIIH